MRTSLFTMLCLLFSHTAAAQSFVLHNEQGGFLDIGEPEKMGAPLPLVVNLYSGLESQLWTFEPVKGLSKDAFVIRSATKGGPVIEVQDPSVRGGIPMLAPYSGASAQRWTTDSSRSPTFVSLKAEPGWVLEVPWHSYVPGHPVGTWSFNDFKHQHWQALFPTTHAAGETGLHCPEPSQPRGNYEFDYGGSPFVTLTADLSFSENSVVVHLTFTAEHPLGTVLARGGWTETLFTAPPGQKVVALRGERHSEYSEWAPAAGAEYGYDCHPGQLLERHPTTGPVEAFFFVGDTGYTDFSISPGCDCDSQLTRVTFKPLELVLAPR